MQSGLLEFFKSYQKGFDDFLAMNIASHYHVPCLISDVDGLNVFNHHEQLINKFMDNCEKMKSIGYSDSDFTIRMIKSLGMDKVEVDLLWTVTLDSGPFQFATLYSCLKSNDQWKIFNATVYDHES